MAATKTTVAGGKGKVVAAKVAGAKPAKGAKGTAKKATSKQPNPEGVAWAGDRIGEASPIKLGKLPPHLLAKVGPAKRDGGYDGETYGVTYGLRVTHFCDHLLASNETLKATDAELNATLVAEYPKRHKPGVSGAQGVKTLQTVAAYRAYTNAVKHGHNCGPKKFVSHSYNADGTPRVKGASKPAPKKPAKKAKAKPAKAS
jgi:hypothetical protein